LGNGFTTDQSTPVSVSNITNATAVSAGLYHTCALLSDSTKSNAGEVVVMVFWEMDQPMIKVLRCM